MLTHNFSSRNYPSRRSLGEEESSMNTRLSGSARVDDLKSYLQGEIRGLTKLVKITEDVRKYATEQGINDEEAVKHCLEEKAAEFAKAGEVYQKV
jgi:hypothetical protein